MQQTSRRDDLIGVLYVLVYLLKGDDLQWLKYSIYMPKENMRSYFKIIYQLKKDLVDDMRKNISNWPVFNPKDTTKTQEQLKFQQKKFIKFTTNILKLGFEDAPNYIKLRKILRDIDSVETRHGFFWVRQQLRMRDSLRNQKFIEILNKELTSEIRTK